MSSRLPFINLLFYVGVMIINMLAVQIPFFGRSPGDVSDLFPNLLTPADFTFKIWSFIYVLLGIFIYYQSKPLFQTKKEIPAEVSSIGLLFVATCLFNFSYLMTWQSLHIVWSSVMIFSLWITLIWINYRLTHLENAHWAYAVPFSFYLAWVCIAALANLNVLLIHSGFEFFGLTEETWTASLIGLGICGTLLVLYLNGDLWFTLVLIWAILGIYIKNVQISPEGSPVIDMALFAMIFLSIACFLVGWRKNKWSFYSP